MSKIEIDTKSLHGMRGVFTRSHVNGSAYHDSDTEIIRWQWPTNGFLTRRLAELRKQTKDEGKRDNRV